jgi:ribose/xylose/arabinose/galactoside ABC-type transport system permease subunit
MIARWTRTRESYLLIAIVLVGIVTGLTHGNFFTTSTMYAITASGAILGVLALGETMVIVGGGIDLSVAPILGLSALVVGMLANNQALPISLAVLVALVIGVVLGAINGVLVVVARLPAIVATIATLSIYGSLEFVYTDGLQVNNMPDAYLTFGNATFLGVPSVVWVFLLVLVAVWYFARFTTLGRDIYASGGNVHAAALRGVNTDRAIFSTYVLSGVLSAIAGFLYITYFANATATTGVDTNLELKAITIALIGGALIGGGRASFVGVAIASMFLSMTLTVAVFFGVPGIWDAAAEGILILAVVLGDATLGRRAVSRVTGGLKRTEGKASGDGKDRADVGVKKTSEFPNNLNARVTVEGSQND